MAIFFATYFATAFHHHGDPTTVLHRYVTTDHHTAPQGASTPSVCVGEGGVSSLYLLIMKGAFQHILPRKLSRSYRICDQHPQHRCGHPIAAFTIEL